eukprot:scaffold59659_cov70-Cyclotella_meneghiniana.AAC.4
MEELAGTTSVAQWLFLLEMFKLFRLVRFNKLLKQSAIISRVWEVLNVATALMTPKPVCGDSWHLSNPGHSVMS